MNDMNDSDMNEVEVERAELDEAVKRYEALERLKANPDFIYLINKVYLGAHATRLVKLRGAGRIHETFQEDVLKEIDAVGYFAAWCRITTGKGQEAKKALEDLVNEMEQEG